MRKLNGITINGEYLGNSVVINGMFRAICTISPVIMRDFVLIINKIEKFEEAVKIKNFNCGFDSIDIEFGNKDSKGIASLYFKLKNGEPELTDCKLVIDNQVYSTLQDKIKLPDKNKVTSPNNQQPAPSSEEERLKKIRELRERKLEQIRQQKEKQQKARPPLAGGANSQRPMSSSAQKALPPKPDKPLTPEEQRMQKRQELLEKKRKAIEARKQAGSPVNNAEQSEGINNADISVQSSEQNFAKNESDNINSEQNTESQKSDTTSNIIQPDAKTGNISDLSDSTGSELKANDNLSEQLQSDTLANEDSQNNSINNIEDKPEEYENYDDNANIDDKPSNFNFDDLSDEDIANMSDEELAALEAELNSELGEDVSDYSDSSYDDGGYYQSDSYQNQNYDMGFAEKLSQQLAQGLTDGLTQGLTQGLAQGLAQGFGGIANQGFGGGGFNNSQGFQGGGFDSSAGGFSNTSSVTGNGGYNFADEGSAPMTQTPLIQKVAPDFGSIDSWNADASINARNSYDYDENSDIDDLSDLYSDFYENSTTDNENNEINSDNPKVKKSVDDPMTSEVEALKAELEALRAEAESKKDLMSLDEFMEKQKELEEAKEKKRRQKLRIVGSQGRVNASALEGGVFVAGKKVYKWGDTKILDD